MQKIGHEFTWEGRPNNTKNILAPLRDQKADTCMFHAILGTVESLDKFKCSCLDPPKDFTWHLCLDNLKCKYEQIVSKELAFEESSKRGKVRLEAGLDTIKGHGVIGSQKDGSEVRFAFRSINML